MRRTPGPAGPVFSAAGSPNASVRVDCCAFVSARLPKFDSRGDIQPGRSARFTGLRPIRPTDSSPKIFIRACIPCATYCSFVNCAQSKVSTTCFQLHDFSRHLDEQSCLAERGNDPLAESRGGFSHPLSRDTRNPTKPSTTNSHTNKPTGVQPREKPSGLITSALS